MTVFGGPNSLTSSVFVLNDTSIIDAGTLQTSFLHKAGQLETIWLTHSHLDHIVDLAFILDAHYATRTVPLKIRGLKETLEVIQKHFLNDLVWPDFSKIPLANAKGMSIEYEIIQVGKRYTIDENTTIEPFSTDHTVASCGYIVSKEKSAILITADTYGLDNVIKSVTAQPNIRTLVIECSFPSTFDALAKASKHLTPARLFEGLKSLESNDLKLYINHIKPCYAQKTTEEIEMMRGNWDVTIINDGDTICY